MTTSVKISFGDIVGKELVVTVANTVTGATVRELILNAHEQVDLVIYGDLSLTTFERDVNTVAAADLVSDDTATPVAPVDVVDPELGVPASVVTGAVLASGDAPLDGDTATDTSGEAASDSDDQDAAQEETFLSKVEHGLQDLGAGIAGLFGSSQDVSAPAAETQTPVDQGYPPAVAADTSSADATQAPVPADAVAPVAETPAVVPADASTPVADADAATQPAEVTPVATDTAPAADVAPVAADIPSAAPADTGATVPATAGAVDQDPSAPTGQVDASAPVVGDAPAVTADTAPAPVAEIPAWGTDQAPQVATPATDTTAQAAPVSGVEVAPVVPTTPAV